MATSMPPGWTVRGTTFLAWLLAAASVMAWALHLASAPRVAVAPAGGGTLAAIDPGAVARLLGGAAPLAAAPGAPAAAPTASRFALLGVVAQARSGAGAAVISVDGRPGRPFRVGSAVDEGLVLRSVGPRQAVIAARPPGTEVITLELPPPRRLP